MSNIKLVARYNIVSYKNWDGLLDYINEPITEDKSIEKVFSDSLIKFADDI